MAVWRVIMTCTVIDTLEAHVEIEALSTQEAADKAVALTNEVEWVSQHDGEINVENVDVAYVTMV